VSLFRPSLDAPGSNAVVQAWSALSRCGIGQSKVGLHDCRLTPVTAASVSERTHSIEILGSPSKSALHQRDFRYGRGENSVRLRLMRSGWLVTVEA